MRRLFAAIMTAAMVIMPIGGNLTAFASEAEDTSENSQTASYDDADYKGETGTCRWYIEDAVLYIEPQDESGVLGTYTEDGSTPWYSYADSITGVSISDGVSAGTSLAYFFSGLSKAEYISFPEDFDTSSVTNMQNTFYNCGSVETLDISSWDVSSVTTMAYEFRGCSSLTSLNIANWETTAITNLQGTFNYSTSITELDLSGWDTSNVTTAAHMFNYCTYLQKLDISGWDASGISNKNYMFANCPNLSYVTLGENWAWGESHNSAATGSLGSYYADYSEGWVRLEDGGSAYGHLTYSSLAENWTSDYAGTWVWGIYKISYNANGGTGKMDSEYAPICVAQNLSANTFAKTGYTFAGWSIEKSGDVAYEDEGKITQTAETDVTLYAQWTANSYTIAFDANADDAEGSTDSIEASYGAEYTLTKNAFTRIGYTFTGWNTDSEGNGIAYADEASVSNLTSESGETVTLYAAWTANTYTVSYDANGGEGSIDSISATYGESFALSDGSGFSRTGYTFNGWNTESDGSGTSYAAGGTAADFTSTDGAAVTLYAQWSANTYTIKFKANGGSGTMAALTATYGKSATLTTNAFKRTGYTFNGWNTESDGSGTSYKNKAFVKNLTATANGTVTLYAQWKKDSTNSSDSYTVPSSSASPSSVDITGATASQVSSTLSKLTSDGDLKGSSYSKLQAKAKKVTRKSITVKWKKVSGAKKYVVYANKCGKSKKLKTLKTTTSTKLKVTKVAGKKVKSGKYYKFLVVAYDSSGKVISASKIVHAATKGKFTNTKTVKIAKGKKTISSLTVPAGKTVKIKGKIVKQNAKKKIRTHRNVKYESTNTSIATVSASGKITGKKEGTCYVYAYAQNGISKKIKVTVK